MVYSIISNNRASRDAHVPAPQLKEDGSPYRFRMFYEGNRYIVDADTAAECVEVLNPGYLGLSAGAQQDVRERLVREVQTDLRTRLVSSADPDLWEQLEDWEEEVLTHFFGDVYGWGDGSKGWTEPVPAVDGKPDVWAAPFPLVLMEEAYQPVGDLPRPLSTEGDFRHVRNLVWLTSEDDEAMLRSFSATGWVTFDWSAGYDPADSNLS